MSKIDERVVGMKFNNDQFQKGVSDTTSALDKLKRALNLDGVAKGLNDLDASGKNFSLAGIANGVEGIAGKFSAMSIVGITALASIASKAVDVGLQMAKSMTIDPIKAGLGEYELKMGSIQTILSNTARFGTSLGDVTGALDQLNTYADKTIYNFGDMTKNIGLFTNAGIRVEDATTMIKGFSNEAAASGTNAQGAASAAYQLSQALSAGTIRLMDWRSLQNVGMGNKNMQNGLIEIAGAMGMLNEETTTAEDIQSNFNGSLEKNWLSADVLSTYLKIMASDNYANARAMALSIGLSEQQADAMAKQAVMSNDAATKVRTFTQLVGTMQESVGSGWAQTFDILIGDFKQATDLWTAVNNELGAMVGRQADARNKLLQGFVDFGGRDKIIQSLANIWNAFQMYLMPITSAWKEIFPPLSVTNLIMIANAFLKFTSTLKPSADTMKEIKRTFMGVFAVLDIGWMILQQIIGLFSRLFGAATEGAGGILSITASIGDFLVQVRDSIKNGTALEKFFTKLGDVLQWPIDKLRELGKWTLSLVSVEGFRKAWEAIGKVFEWLGTVLAPIGKFISEAFQNIKDAVKGFFETMDFNVLVGLLNVGALGAIAFGIKKLVDTIKGMFSKGEGSGLMDTIKGVFGAVTDTFSQMQATLKAGSLTLIAVAIGLMVASVVLLSTVDTGKLFISLGAMSVMFAQLTAMMVAMDKLTSSKGFLKMPVLAYSLGLLAGAMVIFAAALKILATMDWEELARGMSAMAVGLGILIGASALLQKMSGRLIFTAPALVLIAGAMLILAGALKIFSTMSWDDMLRAGTVLAGSLAIIVGAMSLVHSKVFAAASMILIAVAMNILAGAMKVFSTMSWDEIGRAATAFGAAMGIMAVGMAIMGALGVNGLLGAAAMVVAAAAITILAGALKIIATMSWDDIGRSMTVLGAGLAILAAAMAIMGIPLVALGGLALFVVAAGMMMLAPALALLGTMSWDAIGRGMAVLGASLAILAVGGLLLIPASVGFLLFGAALLMIGGAVLMVGQGLVLFATGFAALVAAATLGAPAIVNAMTTIAAGIPAMMAAFAQGLIDFALVIANGAIEFTAAATTLIQAILNGINANAPLVIDTIWNLVVGLVNKVVEGVPFFVESGMKLLIGVIDGINRQMPQLITSATTLIVTFINGIAANLPRIIQAGANLIISFVNGLADGINNNAGRMRDAGGRLATAILDGMTGGLFSGASRVINAAANMAGRAIQAAKDALGINSPSKEFTKLGAWSSEGMANGLVKAIPKVVSATNEVGGTMLMTMEKSLSKIRDSVATDMTMNPTIRPIVDLTNLKQANGLIGGMLTPPSLRVDDSYAYASSIATAQRIAAEDTSNDDGTGDGSGPTYNFIQNNTSPKHLSPAELYRQGSNLLSVVKKGQPTNA